MKHLSSLTALPRRWGVTLVVLIAVSLGPGLVPGQTRWLQNVELITPVREQLVTGALLDTLSDVILRYDVVLKRSPEDADTLSYNALESELWTKGLDFTSATHLFVGYRLEANQRRFNAVITHLYFIYRPPEIVGIDEPIFYLDATQPVIEHVLNNSGTASRFNEAAIIPFREQLTFHKLPESLLVSISGRVIRDSTEAVSEKNRLLATIRRFVFN